MSLCIPEDRIAHHIQILGTTGVRKSTVVRQLVYQFIERGWPCVFLDPKREYLEEFYVDGRDYLIDFADERCVRWRIDNEAEDEPHAMTIAEGAFPDRPGDSYFFKDHARALLAFLIGVYRPTTSQLAKWMANPDDIDMRIKKTEHESTLSKNGPEQRSGILGTLSHLGRPLRWLPDESGRREFSVREWSAHRDGHVFLSSGPNNFAALRPLHALLLDMVLLAMQSKPGPGGVIADEAGRYQRLPQLETALAMQRSSGNPIVLAYHNLAQLEYNYGDKIAESISMLPYTKLVFRSNGKAAEQASKILGHPAQVERIRENKPAFKWFGNSYSSERVMDLPVTPGEIESLEDGHFFFSQAGKIYPSYIKWKPPQKIAPREIRRVVAPLNPNLIIPTQDGADPNKAKHPERYFKPEQTKLQPKTKIRRKPKNQLKETESTT